MGLKPGYKQTEVGVIPEDWQVVSIGTLVTDFRGGAPLRPSDFTQTGVKVLPKGGVGRTGLLKIEDPDLQYCSPAYAASHRRNQVDESFTIVVLRDLVPSGPSIGLMVQIRGRETFVLAQGVYGFKVNEDAAVSSYLVQLSNTKWYRKLANSIMVGSTQVHITNTAFKRAQIPLPQVAEQEAIAEALSDADALIESLEQLIAKKRDLKQGAAQELLTEKKRLPGFCGKWEVKTLGEIGESLIGLTYKPSDVRSNGLLVLRSSNVFEGALRFEDNVFVNMDVPERIIVRKGDILICVRNGSRDLIGKCAWIDERAQGMTFGAFMAVFRTPFHKFVYHQFQSDIIKRQIHEHLGATINQITNKSLNSFQIPFPTDEEEQTAIAAVLSDMDAEIAALEAKLTKAHQIKQGMMHNLLTGRIRLI